MSKTLDDYGEVLHPKDLAEILHVSTKTVYALLNAGTIKSVKIGNRYKIPKTYLQRFLNKKCVN